jgi:hypothetical protein
MRNVYRILAGEIYEKRQFPKPVHRPVDTVEIYHKEKGWKDVYWIFHAYSRKKWCADVNLAMNMWVS